MFLIRRAIARPWYYSMRAKRCACRRLHCEEVAVLEEEEFGLRLSMILWKS